MPHQFASLNCQHCGENYCPVCDELCPKCGKDGIKSDEHRKRMKEWRDSDQKRKIAFEKRNNLKD